MYGVFTFDTRVATGQIVLPVGRLPADRVGSTSRSRSRCRDSGERADRHRPRRRPGDGVRCSGWWPTSWCSGRCATPRRSARSSPRSACRCTSRASPCSTSARSYPTAESVVPDEGVRRTSSGSAGRSPATACSPSFAAVIDRRRRVGGLPVHPLRPGHAGRGRQREGRRAARLLAAAPGRHQLGRSPRCSATLAAILVGPIQGPITPVGLTALIVPALAAALIGGLKSIPIADRPAASRSARSRLAAARALGDDWFDWTRIDAAASATSLPLIVIVVVLFVRGKALPVRGTVEEKRLPLSPDPVRVAAARRRLEHRRHRRSPSCSRTAASRTRLRLARSRRRSWSRSSCSRSSCSPATSGRSRWPRCRWPASPRSSWPG